MTKIKKLTTHTILLTAAIIGLALGGCSDSTPTAPKDTVNEIRELLEQGPSKAAAGFGVKPFVKLDSLKTESVPLGQGQFKINLEITWKTEEVLYAPDEIAMTQLPSVPNSITLLKQVNKSGEKIVVYGSIRAELLTKSHWKLDGSSLAMEDARQGKIGVPIGAFAHNGYVTGTPEADKAIEAQKQLAAELQAKARREAEERRIREEKRAAQERLTNAIRSAQEQRVRIESEIQTTKDNKEQQIKALKADQEVYAQNMRTMATLQEGTNLQMAKANQNLAKDEMQTAERYQKQGVAGRDWSQDVQAWKERVQAAQAKIEQLEKEIQAKIDEVDKSQQMQDLIKQTQTKIDQLDKETQPKLEQLENQAQALKEQEEKLRQQAEALRSQNGQG